MSSHEHLKTIVKSSLFVLANSILEFKDVTLSTHGEVIKTLESGLTRKLIVLPRGCLKSTLCTIAYPIWLLLRNPNERILIDSELFTNSATYLRDIKTHLETNTDLIDLFGPFKSRVWNQDEITIRQRKQPFKEASITAGGIGTTKVGMHHSVIIGDDYNSPRNTATKENAAKVVAHYQYNLSILEPNGSYIIVGTRYSENDLIGHVISNEIGLKKTPLTGVYDLSNIEKSVENESIT